MKLQKPPVTATEHITRAKEERAGGDHTAAQTLALIAIAELLLPVEIAVDAAREPLVNWPGAR